MKRLYIQDTDAPPLNIAFRNRSAALRPEVTIESGEDFRRDISKDSARFLRDWLTEWLDEGEPMTYAAKDVDWLVREVQESMANGNINPNVHALYKAALAPFLPQPDPDADLVEKMVKKAEHLPAPWDYSKDKESDINRSNMRAILAVVRAHDKETP